MQDDQKKPARVLTADAPTAGAITPSVSVLGADVPLAPGAVLADRYEIIRFVARGGMGEVYEALDRELRTRLAVKTLLPHLANNPSAVERVRREVQLARAVTDAHVCRLFDLQYGDIDGRKVTFITMELLEGDSLKERLEQAAVSPLDALNFAIDVTQGLAACHSVGVIHRDLKTENVLLVKRADREHAVLSDFGIARLEVGAGSDRGVADPSLTQEGMLVGSLAFIAPEQINGVRANQRTDLYALGAIFWELVVGPWPLRGKETLEIVRQQAQASPLQSAWPTNLDPLWNEVLQKCLSSRPEERFASAEEVLDKLLPAGPPRRNSGSRLRVTMPPPAPPTPPRAKPLRLIAVAAAVALAAGAYALWPPTAEVKPEAAPTPALPSAEELLKRIQTHEERMEFQQARALARTLGSTKATPGLADYHLASAEAGLRHWTAAAEAAKRALAAQPPLGRRQRLEMELVGKQAQGDIQGVLSLYEPLYATAENDALLSLEYAEVLIPAYKLDLARTVLDAIALDKASPAIQARVALARAFLANTFARPSQSEVYGFAREAVEKAHAVGAQIIEARALALRASAALFLGRVDESLPIVDRSIATLTNADDPFLAWAWRIRGVILGNSNVDPAEGITAATKAIELARELKDDPALSLALNVKSVFVVDQGRLAEAMELYRECEEVALRAGREDIAETRARPNRVALLDDMGQLNEGIRMLEQIHQRRPDPSGLESWNLGLMYRGHGDLKKARELFTQMDGIIKATQIETYRWFQYLGFAELEWDEGNLAKAVQWHQKTETLLKAMGTNDSDGDLAISRSVVLFESNPEQVTRILTPLVTNQDITLKQRAQIIPRLGRAWLRIGKTDEAVKLQKLWQEKSDAYRQFAMGNAELLLLDSELAQTPQALQAAERALEEFGNKMRILGQMQLSWESQLGIARQKARAGDSKGARTLLTTLKSEVHHVGLVRIERSADAIVKTLK